MQPKCSMVLMKSKGKPNWLENQNPNTNPDQQETLQTNQGKVPF